MARVVSYQSERCEAGEKCQHPERLIVIGKDAYGKVAECSEIGLIFSPTGIRHRGCPDVTLDRRFDELVAFALGPRPE